MGSLMPGMNRAIWIGWDPREDAAHAVARRSLLRHLSAPITVNTLCLADLRAMGLYTRPTQNRDGRLIDVLSIRDDYDGSISTEHANARFLVPTLARSGWAMFMDSDMLVRADVAKAFDGLDPMFAVYCVKHKHLPANRTKMDAQIQTQYERKNWSSLVVFNCDHDANASLTVEMVNTLPGRDLHRFCWLDDSEIGELDPSWNWLVGHSDPSMDPGIVHFTDGVPSMPGYEDVPYADEWRAELARSA
jgi:hypothetical protein